MALNSLKQQYDYKRGRQQSKGGAIVIQNRHNFESEVMRRLTQSHYAPCAAGIPE